MLCELKVENLALIELLQLQFGASGNTAQLIVMTGETGAGKSIMLRAIHLLTGARASTDWIRNGADNCSVEALFEIRPEHTALREILRESDLGDETTVIIRRVLQANGRSRLYVNGSLATAKMVADLTDNLLSIASQHDHQQLLQPSLHLDFLDSVGELGEQVREFSGAYAVWQVKKGELDDLHRQEKDKEKRKDLLRFQVDEIRDAMLEVGEDEALETEKKRLKNLDLLIKLSHESSRFLSTGVIEGLVKIRKNMEQVASLDPAAGKLAEDLTGYTYQAEDLVAELRHYCNSLESDPLRLDQVSFRIDLLRQLKRKYGETIAAILAFAEEAQQELEILENLDIKMDGLAKEVAGLAAKLMAMARDLSEKRRQAAGNLEKAMGEELASLAFNQAVFQVRWQEIENDISQIRASGWDRIEFFFTANPGEPSRPLAKVASGGELSRLMLALKCLLAKRDMVETVIFDEVDAGIGGEAAEAVARKIQELAGHHQVFCITHLPQIAARGTDHFLVVKNVVEGRSQSSFSQLSREERVGELARMLAGASVSTKTYAWAQELLDKGAGR
ncbi:MAG: DNA repair protein RecN [Desulfocapsaceae bacterium]|nr:DNA repair protein RecN [Desulfocapsaceae bacterium]